MAIAYSYIRFSSEKQAEGDSLRRQLEAAEKFATANNLELDTRTYRDLGISAFKGKNKDEGALGAFLKCVQEGVIPVGTVLIIESLDRMSRENVNTALSLFLQIVNLGITIVTLSDSQTYSVESINKNWTQLVVALAVMARSNEESAMKSLRIKEAWVKRKERGDVPVHMLPGWLKRDEAKNIVVDEDRLLVVKRIFQMAFDGYGMPKIVKALNEEKVPTFGRSPHWVIGTVQNILTSQNTIGHRLTKDRTEVTKNVYPAVLDESYYWEVQHRIKNRHRGTGSKDMLKVGISNLFATISYCKVCGSRMRSVGSDGKHTYLKCLASYSKTGLCDEGPFPYLAAEQMLLDKWSEQGRLAIIGPDNFKNDAQLEAVNAELADVRLKLREATGLFEEMPSKAVAASIAKFEASEEKLKKLLIKLERESGKGAGAMALVAKTQSLVDKHEELLRIGGDELKDARRKIQTAVRRFIKKIEFDATEKKVNVTYASGTVRLYSVERYMKPAGFQKGNRNGVVEGT